MSGKATGWVLKHYPVTQSSDRTRKLVLLSVADAANQYGTYARPGLAVVCQEWAFDKTTVIRHLNALVEDGWLEVIEAGRGRGHATVYALPRMVAENDLSDEKGGAIEEERLQDSPEKVAGTQLLTSLSTVEKTVENYGVRVSDSERVFDAWKQATGRNGRTVFDTKRKRSVKAALRDYPLEDVIDAVRGWDKSAWHAGQNDARKVYNELTLLLRDGAQIEMFRDLERGTAPVGRGADPGLSLIARMRAREGR